MRPAQRRIPSSIRVRRSDTDLSRNSYYSSADTYARRADENNADAQSITTNLPTSSRTGQPSSNDYFTLRGPRRGPTSTPGHDFGTPRGEGVTPSSEGHWHTPTGRLDEEEDDDETLRREMEAARRAIYDQERREQRQGRRDRRSVRVPPGDYPPIRLNDTVLEPSVPPRTTSRRPGAVEGLAMRHHHQRREERRRARQDRHSSVSTSSSRSSSTESRGDSAADDPNPARGGSDAIPTYPPPHPRNLSDVQEEPTSRNTTSQTQIVPVDQDTEAKSGKHGNTTTDDGLMAASRRLYDQLLRRKSDRGLADDDNEQQESQRRSRRRGDDDRDDDHSTPSSEASGMHEDEVVDYLDVVDPEVATVTALQNVGNSIFFPPIPMLYNRRPTISLPAATTRQTSPSARPTPRDEQRLDDIEMGLRSGDARPESGQETSDTDTSRLAGFSGMRRVASLVPGRKRKKIPPTTEEERRKHIKEWAEMDEEERNELDEHVRLLLTKKAKFKRGLRGFWRYVKTPHGFIITTYAFLITFWGTAIVLFILRWIDVGNRDRQRYWIEICDQILCALFTAVGLGFAPFRAVDTYRMVQIAHYHFLTYKRRRELHLPELKDKNELPRAAPRLSVAQMTNTMMIKTKLRKSPGPDTADEGTTEGGHGQQGSSETQAADQVRTASVDSSWELLDAVQSRRSANEVEELKEKRKKKHAWFHRKKHSDDEKAARDPSKRDSAGTSSSAGDAPEPGPIEGPRKTYANKDGVIPLGQLKRNPSIASELPRDAEEEVVLSPKQQANLEYQQRKFHESHTFYRYRETVTHRPFELPLMMAIVILLDCHSCLQASLGGTTWGIYYKNRPTSVTATIITFSLSCNAVAGILIWLGGNRTKKKEEVERLLGIALEEEALRKIRKKERRKRMDEEEGEVMSELDRVNSRGRDGRFIVGRVSTEVKRSSPALERIQEQ